MRNRKRDSPQSKLMECLIMTAADIKINRRDSVSASRPGRPPKRASGVGLSLAATQFPGHPFKKHRLENGDYSPYENGHMSDMARMEKSPLLANGYNAPPTHLGPMGFMHQHALMSPMHPGVPRPDGSIIKGQPMHNMEALARYSVRAWAFTGRADPSELQFQLGHNTSGIWENCRAAYEDIVKHLERLAILAVNQSLSQLAVNKSSGSMRSSAPIRVQFELASLNRDLPPGPRGSPGRGLIRHTSLRHPSLFILPLAPR
ncbi:hypothetical protein RR48_14843 [Papilio machaon]|uniref:Uncharacterized protein n=1 Tax=Papilio machaon TaxID=76193 RepID=A0A194R114_PAPMA|nr:hypothetical protein RR48_14843 [Papilio machaon]